jgi:hypothetical protein
MNASHRGQTASAHPDQSALPDIFGSDKIINMFHLLSAGLQP